MCSFVAAAAAALCIALIAHANRMYVIKLTRVVCASMKRVRSFPSERLRVTSFFFLAERKNSWVFNCVWIRLDSDEISRR